MPNIDEQGMPVSNMDDVTIRREDGDIVVYDCYGNVDYRIVAEANDPPCDHGNATNAPVSKCTHGA